MRERKRRAKSEEKVDETKKPLTLYVLFIGYGIIPFVLFHYSSDFLHFKSEYNEIVQVAIAMIIAILGVCMFSFGYWWLFDRHRSKEGSGRYKKRPERNNKLLTGEESAVEPNSSSSEEDDNDELAKCCVEIEILERKLAELKRIKTECEKRLKLKPTRKLSVF